MQFNNVTYVILDLMYILFDKRKHWIIKSCPHDLQWVANDKLYIYTFVIRLIIIHFVTESFKVIGWNRIAIACLLILDACYKCKKCTIEEFLLRLIYWAFFFLFERENFSCHLTKDACLWKYLPLILAFMLQNLFIKHKAYKL